MTSQGIEALLFVEDVIEGVLVDVFTSVGKRLHGRLFLLVRTNPITFLILFVLERLRRINTLFCFLFHAMVVRCLYPTEDPRQVAERTDIAFIALKGDN